MARKRSIDQLDIIALDPSKKTCGWSRLLPCENIIAGTFTSKIRSVEMAINQIVRQIRAEFDGSSNVVILEKPIRLEGWSDNKKESIDKLLIEYGAYLSLFMPLYPSTRLWTPTAPEWKGQAPKAVTHKRAYKALKNAGIEIVSENLDHNAKDAIALIATYLQKEGYID